MSDWELATDVDKRISVATIQADKIVLSNDTKVPLFKVEGGQVWTANLTIEGFMNRKAMELTNNNLISVAYPCEDSTSSIAPMAERATIQMTSYSLDLLLCTDTIVFDFNSDMVTFVLPSYARLDMNDADPYAYIRPCTKYQTATKKGMLMTLAQMRMLVGRKFVFINRGKANVIFQIGTLFNITHDDIITLPSTPNYDYEVGIGANKMGVFELRSGEYQGKDEYGADEWHECLYWRFSESDSRTLNEFIDT